MSVHRISQIRGTTGGRRQGSAASRLRTARMEGCVRYLQPLISDLKTSDRFLCLFKQLIMGSEKLRTLINRAKLTKRSTATDFS